MSQSSANLSPSRSGWDFASCAWLVLAGSAPALDEDVFWDLLDEIGWGPKASVGRAAKVLVGRISAADCAGAIGCAQALGRRLAERLEQWEYECGEPLGLADDRFMILVDHLVGLGQATFERVLRDPALARRWVRQARLKGGAMRVLGFARGLYPVAEVSEALRAFGEPDPFDDPSPSPDCDQRLVVHPDHGLGVVLVRQDHTRIVFADGDLSI